ncbi:hypothetical protein AMATHDRAFT_6553 [Amanita thiersii Skay4041]|uniref:Uncharacterized protein n=1 Tax=Amanita thiersii Skay4041 TaxID=703135 RepID=A0A2A9N9J8_9AGAR|nr:hypothetical protein AMATHDRAFT_6553 [Amanita thiersii Skay4041]
MYEEIMRDHFDAHDSRLNEGSVYSELIIFQIKKQDVESNLKIESYTVTLKGNQLLRMCKNPPYIEDCWHAKA